MDFRQYFAQELTQLQPLANDGLLSVSGNRIQVLPRGRLLIRNICMVFDAYLQGTDTPTRYSRVI